MTHHGLFDNTYYLLSVPKVLCGWVASTIEWSGYDLGRFAADNPIPELPSPFTPSDLSKTSMTNS